MARSALDLERDLAATRDPMVGTRKPQPRGAACGVAPCARKRQGETAPLAAVAGAVACAVPGRARSVAVRSDRRDRK